MALVACEECGNSVSEKALACPRCGNPGPFADGSPSAAKGQESQLSSDTVEEAPMPEGETEKFVHEEKRSEADHKIDRGNPPVAKDLTEAIGVGLAASPSTEGDKSTSSCPKKDQGASGHDMVVDIGRRDELKAEQEALRKSLAKIRPIIDTLKMFAFLFAISAIVYGITGGGIFIAGPITWLPLGVTFFVRWSQHNKVSEKLEEVSKILLELETAMGIQVAK